MKSNYTPKPHIKMYAEASFIKAVQEAAKKEGLTQSAFIFLTMKNKIKRSK